MVNPCARVSTIFQLFLHHLVFAKLASSIKGFKVSDIVVVCG